MAERKTGAGLHLSGVLERSAAPTPPKPVAPAPAPEPDDEAPPTTPAEEPADDGAAGGKGRGGGARGKGIAARQAKKIKGRTIYLPDDLFERVLVQAHRKEQTISDYVAALLNRHVPDHRGDGAAA